MDKHDNEAGFRFAELEERLKLLITRMEAMTIAMAEMKAEQDNLVELIKRKLLK